jgi:enamine deaminase RidA (YjgF/YER057c/UK114 family)
MARETVKAKGLHRMPGPQSVAIKADNWVFTSGLARERGAADEDGLRAEAEQCIDDLVTVLKAVDAGLESVAKLRAYASDARFFAAIDQAIVQRFGESGPARATVADGPLLPFSRLQLEATAYTGASVKVIEANGLHQAPGRASAGTVAGNVFFSNGMLPFDQNGEFMGVGNIRAQVEQSLDNLGVALRAAGFDYSDVVRIHNAVPAWFGFDRYNEMYQKYFREPFGVRATIQGVPEHMTALVQFEAIAAKGHRRTVESEDGGSAHFTLKRDKNTIYLSELPGALAPHSHAVQVGNVVYLCGEVGYDNSGRLVKRSDIRAQTKKTMQNLAMCMEALGGSAKDIVKTNVSLTDPRMIDDFFDEYAKFLDRPYPAMNLVVAGLAQDCMVLEIEAIGILGASSDAIAVVVE